MEAPDQGLSFIYIEFHYSELANMGSPKKPRITQFFYTDCLSLFYACIKQEIG